MGSLYRLDIECDYDQKQKINSILEISDRQPDAGWSLIIDEESEDFIHALDIFINLIAKNLDALDTIGVSSEFISFWYLYEYDQQCNIEFNPKITKQIGDLGVVLCVSCWQK